MSGGAGVGIVNSSKNRVGYVRKVAQKTDAGGTAGSGSIPSEGSALQAALLQGKILAKSVAELPQVPRAPTVVVSEAKEPTCAVDERHELEMVGSGRRPETNVYRATQPVSNQGLLIVVLMSVEDYIKEV